MYITHKGHNNTKQIYSVTAMTHVIALEGGQSSLGHLSLLHRGSSSQANIAHI